MVTNSLWDQENIKVLEDQSVRSLPHLPGVRKHQSCDQLIVSERSFTSIENLEWALNLPKTLSFNLVEQSGQASQVTPGISYLLLLCLYSWSYAVLSVHLLGILAKPHQVRKNVGTCSNIFVERYPFGG